MKGMSFTQLRHYLNEDDSVPDLPGPAMNVLLFLGSIVGWVSRIPAQDFESTNVPCRRNSGRKRCRGEIVARQLEDNGIQWECPVCGDAGVVSNWEGTKWDKTEGDL